ncbi:dihydrolipoyl dehydrogenase [Nocardioides sp. R-C-SC26]|uniref:dihydrolipoyl dehydrogenase n=1 Tax=Nocardioides sp. R-C-SC26 TaxID=2870414 RepID=UPI001E589F6F|nr:dihydrolipoyl dehydrogenase [Nocardioides sp. R-C-SC26]
MVRTDYDVLVLGAGSGGYACALRAAQLGLDVGLIEESRLGGTCLHQGCIPTKALLHAAEVADSAREADRFGVRATLEGIDVPRVLEYQQGVVDRLFRGLTGLVKGRGITLIEGRGEFVGPREIEVDGAIHRGRHVVVATGSASRTLPGLGVDGERVLTSDHAVRLDRVPSRAVVVGGGVIGCEFASAWRSFGSEVTIVEAADRLLPSEDEASSAALARAFGKRGITVRTATAFASIAHTGDGVALTVADGSVIEADVVLVAVGRGPLTDGIGLEKADVTLEHGLVVVDEFCRTSAEGTYAVGDIVAGPQLAHRGFAQGILVAEHIAGLAPQPIDEAGIPRVTYSRPEVASVGLTEAAARGRYGGGGRTLVYDLAGNGKSQILRTQGSIKLVQAPGGAVVGLHLVGERVGELIGEAQLIYGWDAHAEDVAPLVHAHPTQNEALGEAHLALAGKPLHAHG